MKLAILALALFAKPKADLKAQIDLIYLRSVNECELFHYGDMDCIKHQFRANFSYYIVKDVDGRVGHPGVPGPILP